MILVIGGKGSGKADYVASLGYAPEQIAQNIEAETPVLYGLQEIVAQNPAKAMELLEDLLKKEVVVCDEVGSGVIPLQREQREFREATGRLCIALAREASQVVRLVCGIPQVIKP